MRYIWNTAKSDFLENRRDYFVVARRLNYIDQHMALDVGVV